MSKAALIMGGSSGIGAAISRSLLDDGFDIVITYNKNLYGAEEISEYGRVKGKKVEIVQFDVETYVKTLEKIISAIRIRHEKLSVVVNCIGNSQITEICEDGSFEKWRKAVEINLNYLFLLSKVTLPILNENRWGRWINISSVSSLELRSRVAPYGVTKSAQNRLVKFLAKEAYKDVTVNSISPGMTETEHLMESNKKLATNMGKTLDEINSEILSETFTKSFIQPNEVGAYVSFLCKEEAKSITGQNHVIAAGRGV